MPQPAPQLVAEDAADLTVATWRFLEQETAELKAPLLGPVQPISEFLEDANRKRTPLKDRIAIVEQAELLFDHLYPHLPFKLETFHLEHPRQYLEKARAGAPSDHEAAFQGAMIAAFSRVKDAHTTYACPPPWRGAIAFLPFQIKTILNNEPPFNNRYFVSRVMKQSADEPFAHKLFGPGAEIVGWGATPIEEYVRAVADWLPGGNAAALHARGALASTLRPLTSVHPPFVTEFAGADIRYIPKGRSETRAIRMPWGVARFKSAPAIPGSTFSVSSIHEDYNTGLKMQYRDAMRFEQRNANWNDPRAVSTMPEVFEFQFTGGPNTDYPIDINILSAPGQGEPRRFGYLRIKAFRDNGKPFGMADRLVDEARRILTLLDQQAPDGLIVDIRGNPGGEIKAAERILQLLTAAEIEPQVFHYANTEAVQNALRRVRAGQASPTALVEFELSAADAGRTPISQSDKIEDRLTTGVPITNPAAANDVGQAYHGPVTLLTDAFTYSAADIFAAGFQDHLIGFMLGADQFTGGGGANVWNHGDLVKKLGPDLAIPLAPLPEGVGMRLAFRRCSRKGFSKGEPVEDLGVRVNEVYILRTVDDLLADFPGMVIEAMRLFSINRATKLEVKSVTERGRQFLVKVSTENVATLRFLFDGVQGAERALTKGGEQTFRVSPPANRSNPFTLRVEGFLPVQDWPGRLVRVGAKSIPLRPPETTTNADNVAAELANFNFFFKP